jgi:hypothetical protein
MISSIAEAVKVNPDSHAIKGPYPMECIYHPPIIGRIGDIEGNYVKVFFQEVKLICRR